MFKQFLQDKIVRALDRTPFSPPEGQPEVEEPSGDEFGDYASNIALVLGSQNENSPREIAETIVEEIDHEGIKHIQIAGPGFINFYLKSSLLSEALHKVLERGKCYGASDVGRNQRIQVEFVSSNPTGPLTVGHGRQAVLGDILSSIYEKLGYQVSKEYYFNDEGRQMDLLAKTLWARYKQALGRDVEIPEEGYRGEYLVQLGEEIAQEQGKRYLEWSEETAQVFKNIGLEEMIDRIQSDLEELGVEFDRWFRESKLHAEGAVEKTLSALREKDALYEKDGAVWLKAEEEGAPKDPVLIKSDGSPTYLLPDIAYHLDKLERGFDKAVVLLGADHQRHVENMQAALRKLDFPENFYEVYLSQFVSLKQEGKIKRMSTRRGEFVTLRSLLEDLGRDVVRYFMAARRPDSHLEFDYNLAKDRSMDNPVYYLQYAHTRIAGIFREAENTPEELPSLKLNLEKLEEAEEQQLIKLLDKYPEVVERSGMEFAPHSLTKYAEDLAAAFHQFYNKHQVLTSDEELAKARMALALSVQNVVRSVLGLLGVSAPSRM